MSKQVRKPLSIALGAAVVASLGTAGIANAETDADLFSMEELASGYLVADEEGSCGEGKCGEDSGDKDGEGSCGEDGGDKDGEGKCGSA